ncbi:MAG: 3-phosphoshikimate 1-carboxyvinyltransferase, partial [Candidatus Omnitrophota bacterium]
TIRNFSANEDCLNTVKAFRQLGVKITNLKERSLVVFGRGLLDISNSKRSIFVGESGTTLRLLLGVLAGQNFEVTLSAGKSLSKRPMLRVTMPLRLMGAQISAERKARSGKSEEYPPITIRGGKLKAITYKMPVASAQVKSALLLAGLYAEGTTQVIESVKTRDHTERMLKLFGADLTAQRNKIAVKRNNRLNSPGQIYIPGDISSASFFIVLAAICLDSQILLKNAGLNPLRIGIIKVLRRMGAIIKVTSHQSPVTGGEPMGDIEVKSSKLKGTVVKKNEIPSLIDELPILMVAACFAQGRTVFKGVEELRVKETDRIKSMCFNLEKMGADIKVIKAAGLEQIVIQGGKELSGANLKSFGDHRTAMSMIVAGLRARGVSRIDDITCINKSFPDFLSILGKRMRPCV